MHDHDIHMDSFYKGNTTPVGTLPEEDALYTESMIPEGTLTEKGSVVEPGESTCVELEDGVDVVDYPDVLLQQVKGFPDENTQNVYVGKRNFVHQMMDVALMMANVSQLRALLYSEENNYYTLTFSVIVLSITLQIIFTLCMITIWSLEKAIEDYERTEKDTVCKQIENRKSLASTLDRCGNILVLGIIVSNVFITGFGVGDNQYSPALINAKSDLIRNNILIQNSTSTI